MCVAFTVQMKSKHDEVQCHIVILTNYCRYRLSAKQKKLSFSDSDRDLLTMRVTLAHRARARLQ